MSCSCEPGKILVENIQCDVWSQNLLSQHFPVCLSLTEGDQNVFQNNNPFLLIKVANVAVFCLVSRWGEESYN